MKRSKVLALLFGMLILISLSTETASAETLIVNPMKDNTIYEGSPYQGNSCGAGTGMIAGRTSDKVVLTGVVRRGLVSFDVSAIPAGSTIASVSLTMTVDRSSAATPALVSLHELLSDWGEGASNCDASPGQGVLAVPPDATWIHRITGNTPIPWANSGGDYAAAASATTSVGTANGLYRWSGAGMVSDVLSWVNNPGTNFGWIVIGDEGGTLQTTYLFGSRESVTQPELAVVFTPPAAVEPCCSPAKDCSFVSVGTCAASGGIPPGGTTCSPTTCDTTPRACCIPNENLNFTCQDVSPGDCVLSGGTPQAIGSGCRDTNICGLTPYVDALPIPPVMQPVGTDAAGNSVYDVTMTQFQQQLHRDLPATTVWGYNGSYPGPTILATEGKPIVVNYINDLRDAQGNLRAEHYLTVDQCPHGPNYWGTAPRTVVHLHGGHVPARFDGLPEFDFFPGEFDTYKYPNNQIPTTLWFHDHALGITRLNVTMGLAAFYLLQPDCQVTPQDVECQSQLPSGKYEMGLAIQDRNFNLQTGQLRYPAKLQQMFHGENILVNGKVWPYLKVDQGKYRFRILNGSSTRTYTLSILNPANNQKLPLTVIGNEGGLFSAPRTAADLTMGPAERFDVIVDFAGLPRNAELFMKNSAVEDFPIGGMPTGGTQNVMKFIVSGRTGFTGSVPINLRPFVPPSPINAATRTFNLIRVAEPCAGAEWLVQSLDSRGNVIGEHWDDITDFPVLGATEIWEFRNNSNIMHPMHIHDVHFQVLNRQAIDANGNPTGPIIQPEPLELNSWKDTVKAMPGQVVRAIMRFDDYLGKYPFHCHIIEHEDHEMMRQFQVVNPQSPTCGNGTCDTGEDCVSCPTDCQKVSGARCGNGLCEIGDNEDCLSCPADCAGQTGTGGFCCGNPMMNPTYVDCMDPRCTTAGFFCRMMPRVQACCGDMLCEGAETAGSCSADCGPACTFNVPTVTITPTAQDITTNGGSVTYGVTVKNNDSGSCNPSTYALSFSDSNLTNFASSILGQSSVTLFPGGASSNIPLTVKALAGAPDRSQNDTTVTASAPAHTDGSATARTTVKVQPTTVGVSSLRTGTMERRVPFSPQTTFTVGQDVYIESTVVMTGIATPVNSATVTQQIIASNGAVVATLTSSTDANGLAYAKFRTRNATRGTYTVRVTNVSNGYGWDGIIKTTTFTLN